MGYGDFYETLINEVDSDAYVESVLCGKFWTLVKNSEGGLGMALSTGSSGREAIMDHYVGLSVKEAASCMLSWNMKEAGIGMAAANSFFNTPERLESLRLEQPDSRWCTFNLDLKDKTIVMVGHLRHDEDLFSEAAAVNILEMNPEPGDYPASACEYIIPGCDVLVISASAIVNRTLPRLLELGKDSYTIITGPTAPMCSKLTELFDIQRVAGFIPVDTESIWQRTCLNDDRSPYSDGRRFYIEQGERS